jgi:hypothetical protein
VRPEKAPAFLSFRILYGLRHIHAGTAAGVAAELPAEDGYRNPTTQKIVARAAVSFRAFYALLLGAFSAPRAPARRPPRRR